MIGCLTAYYLTLRGARVTVVEMTGVAARASGKATGRLTPYFLGCEPDLLALSPATLALHAQLKHDLPEATGVDYGYDERPYLRIARDEQGAETLRVWQSDRRSEGVEARWIEPAEARSLSPWLTEDFVAALECNFEPTLDSFLFTTSAWAVAKMNGARLVTAQATGLKTDGRSRRARGVRISDGSTIPAETVVVANGAWSGGAGEWLGVDVPVRPQKGQLLILSDEATGKSPVGIIDIEGKYSIKPKRLGGTFFGSTTENAGFDITPTEKARNEMVAAMAGLSDRLSASNVITHTACLRPMTPDGKPIVGAVTGWEGVYLATGHWSKGIHFAPVTGKWLADMIADGESEYDLSALSPARFAGSAGAMLPRP